MVKHISFLFLLIGCSLASFAQKYDVGINIGGTAYLGELNPRQFYNFNRGGIGIIARRNFNPDFAVKFTFSEFLLHGEDQGTGDRNRNLFFTSYVTEASLQFEFNFFKYNPFDDRERYSPYVFVGIGAFHFNPYTFLYNHKVFLKEVGTEVDRVAPVPLGGQTPSTVSGSQSIPPRASTIAGGSQTGLPVGMDPRGSLTAPLLGAPRPGSELDGVPFPSKYALTSVCIPIGLGYKFHLKEHWSMNIEYGIRLTFTDYLDDVSGRYPTYTSSEGFITAYNASAKVEGHDLPVPLSNRGSVGYLPGAQRGDSWKYDKYLYGSVGIVYTFRSDNCPKFKK